MDENTVQQRTGIYKRDSNGNSRTKKLNYLKLSSLHVFNSRLDTEENRKTA